MSNDQPDGISIIRVEECDEEQFIRLLFHCWFGIPDETRLSCLIDLLIFGLGYTGELTAVVSELMRARDLVSSDIITELRDPAYKKMASADRAFTAFQTILNRLPSNASDQRLGCLSAELSQSCLEYFARFLEQHASPKPRPDYFLPFHGFYLAFRHRTGELLGCMSCQPERILVAVGKPPGVVAESGSSFTSNYWGDADIAELLIVDIDVRFGEYQRRFPSEHRLDHSLNKAVLQAAMAKGFVPSSHMLKPDGTESCLP